MLTPLPLAEIMEHKRNRYRQTITCHELDYIRRINHMPLGTWQKPVVN